MARQSLWFTLGPSKGVGGVSDRPSMIVFRLSLETIRCCQATVNGFARRNIIIIMYGREIGFVK